MRLQSSVHIFLAALLVLDLLSAGSSSDPKAARLFFSQMLDHEKDYMRYEPIMASQEPSARPEANVEKSWLLKLYRRRITFNSATGKYECVFRIDDSIWRVDPELYPLINAAMRYIEQGSNLQFFEAKGGGRAHIVFRTNAHQSACLTDYGPDPVDILLAGNTCRNIPVVLHEIMHALGITHEFERPDFSFYIRGSSPKQRVEDFKHCSSSSSFDYFSIMMYTGFTLRAMGMYLPPGYSNLAASRFNNFHMYITRCDWNFLNTYYPGERLPPACYNEIIPQTVTPRPGHSLQMCLQHVPAHWHAECDTPYPFQIEIIPNKTRLRELYGASSLRNTIEFYDEDINAMSRWEHWFSRRIGVEEQMHRRNLLRLQLETYRFQFDILRWAFGNIKSWYLSAVRSAAPEAPCASRVIYDFLMNSVRIKRRRKTLMAELLFLTRAPRVTLPKLRLAKPKRTGLKELSVKSFVKSFVHTKDHRRDSQCQAAALILSLGETSLASTILRKVQSLDQFCTVHLP